MSLITCFLPPTRYPDVSCSSQSGECPDLNLGLLDFGASYTVILTEVRMPDTQITFCYKNCKTDPMHELIFVPFFRPLGKLCLTRWRT